MATYDWYCDDVLSGDLEVNRVYEDDLVLAFHHPYPSARPHVVVVPKAHVGSLLADEALDGPLLVSMIRAVQHAAMTAGFATDAGWYIRANAGAPEVTPHMHWHVLPGAIEYWPEFEATAEA